MKTEEEIRRMADTLVLRYKIHLENGDKQEAYKIIERLCVMSWIFDDDAGSDNRMG